MWADSLHSTIPQIDFAAHAASLGARAEKVASIGELEQALHRARQSDRTYVIVIETDPTATTETGGAWWDVAIPEVSQRPEVRAARAAYVDRLRQRAPKELKS
jgi:3D-(3,5/4)-trihydroxycyclohexane-1,2-dione acylhydrolase (decyclizing)